MAHCITENDLFKDKKDKYMSEDPTIINTKKAEVILQTKSLSKTEYLYGTKDIEPIPEEFIKYRIQKLDNHLKSLLTVPYMERDTGRVNKVIKAIEFWQNIKDN
jgi:hypothetical protein